MNPCAWIPAAARRSCRHACPSSCSGPRKWAGRCRRAAARCRSGTRARSGSIRPHAAPPTPQSAAARSVVRVVRRRTADGRGGAAGRGVREPPAGRRSRRAALVRQAASEAGEGVVARLPTAQCEVPYPVRRAVPRNRLTGSRSSPAMSTNRGSAPHPSSIASGRPPCRGSAHGPRLTPPGTQPGERAAPARRASGPASPQRRCAADRARPCGRTAHLLRGLAARGARSGRPTGRSRAAVRSAPAASSSGEQPARLSHT